MFPDNYCSKLLGITIIILLQVTRYNYILLQVTRYNYCYKLLGICVRNCTHAHVNP